MYVYVGYACQDFHLGAVKRCMFSCIVFKTILPANSRKGLKHDSKEFNHYSLWQALAYPSKDVHCACS